MFETPNATEPVPEMHRRNRGRMIALGGAGVIALLLCFTAVAAATPPPALTGSSGVGIESAGATTPATESWAWGAAANISLRSDFVGAYNGSSSLGGGNLTENGVYVAVQEAANIGYAAFVVVTAQFASTGAVFVTLQAAEYSTEQIGIAASGTFPSAGTYNASTPAPLVPMNISLDASTATLTSISGFLNYTSGPNGSLALVNEHLDVLQGIAVGLSASDFPNETVAANGDTTLKYVSGSMAEDAWEAVNFSASFSPALTLVQGPVQVGESWLANSTASVNGTMAYAANYAVALPGGPTERWSQSAESRLSTEVAVALYGSVVGTQTVHLADGGTETDYVIVYTTAPGSSNWTVVDGLFALPGGNGTSTSTVAAGIPEQPVRAAVSSAAPSASSSARILYSPARGLPDSESASPAGAGSVTAAPMTPPEASAAMSQLHSPHADLPDPTSSGGATALVAAVALTVSVIGIVAWHRRQIRRWD